jgi:serine/threonine protein kinase
MRGTSYTLRSPEIPNLFHCFRYRYLGTFTATSKPSNCTANLGMSHPDLPESSFIGRGELIATGLTGIVERVDGYAIKTPWPGDEQSQADIRLEARAYERIAQTLGRHVRFVEDVAFDRERLTLTMRYMVNGTLRQYLQSNHQNITLHQRHLWIQAMAEGLALIHELGIVHCDLTPNNMFLDDKLELKIADFGCCSIDRSGSTAATDARFYPPRPFWSSPVCADDDLYALGSCVYEVLTGMAPFGDVASSQVRSLAGLRQFPDLASLEYRHVVRDCWLGRAQSAKHVLGRVAQA